MLWLVVCDILQDKNKSALVAVHVTLSYRLRSSCISVIVQQDKEMAIPHEDLGRSITTVQVLQRKHEAFERELSALGSKVGEKLCIWQ